MERIFYRVGNINSEGLWYNYDGNFTGRIHKLDFLSNHKLPMPFEPELVGYLSAVETLEQLYKWFTREDIIRLQDMEYRIIEYISTDYKYYDYYQHYVINKETSIVNNNLIIL
jgi:hypothetical protein